VLWSEVEVPSHVCDLEYTPIFEWCMVGSEDRMGYREL
jgi:hypothetical protein